MMREAEATSDAVRKAEEIAHATEWSGDLRVNFLTAINAAKVLQAEIERLREEVRNKDIEINDIRENLEWT